MLVGPQNPLHINKTTSKNQQGSVFVFFSCSTTKCSSRLGWDFLGQPGFTLGFRTMTSCLLPHMITLRKALCIISWHFRNAGAANEVRAPMLYLIQGLQSLESSPGQASALFEWSFQRSAPNAGLLQLLHLVLCSAHPQDM